MGPLTFGKKEEQIFLGREIAQHQDYSEDTAVRIDQEIRKVVTDNYTRAKQTIEQHRSVLERIAQELLLREVLDAEQVKKLVAGEALDEFKAAASPAADQGDSRKPVRERPAIVPLHKPVTQE
jgi:cell division protease FtsH